MRKYIIFMLIHVSIASVYAKTYTLDFKQQDFIFQTANGVLNIDPKTTNYFFSEDISTPALLYSTLNVLIPDGAIIKDFTFDMQQNVITTGVYIEPSPKVLPTNVLPLLYEDSEKIKYTKKITINRLKVKVG